MQSQVGFVLNRMENASTAMVWKFMFFRIKVEINHLGSTDAILGQILPRQPVYFCC